MTIDRNKFFTELGGSLFNGNLSNTQKKGIDTLLSYWESSLADQDKRWLAYVFGTVHHEAQKTMRPIKEKGDDSYFYRKYDINGDRPEKAQELGNVMPGDGVKFCGRGFVQLTGRSNYTYWAERLKVNLVEEPDIALRHDIATKIIIDGMIQGNFTGKKLNDYFNATKDDWVNARRIVNGIDKAELVADYAKQYYAAIQHSVIDQPEPIFGNGDTAMSLLNELINVPRAINTGLDSVPNHIIVSLLGSPSGRYSCKCGSPTNANFKARVVKQDIGPFKVSGFDLAVESLKFIMADIQTEQPEVAGSLGTAGMLCCRFIRGSNAVLSNHSWGTAIDLSINGEVDGLGDNQVQRGLVLIAPIFQRHGWFWGAGFRRREDSMHFEVSQQKLLEWHEQGELFAGRALPINKSMRIGDRGEHVKHFQKQLNKLGYHLKADGIFGPATHAAVIDFQAGNGLEDDGIVGVKTLAVLASLLS